MIYNVNGVNLIIERIANVDLFSIDISDILPEPQVPMFHREDIDVWEPNYNNPTYHAAMSVYFAGKTIALFDAMLKRYVQVENKEQIVIPKNIRRMYPEYDDEFIFLKYILLIEDEDVGNIVNTVTLTESRVYDIFKTLRVMREGRDIHQHEVKHTVNTNIEYEPIVLGGHQLVHPLDEYNGCTISNISYTDWIEHKFSLNSMAKTIAMYRLNKIIEIHSSDASQEHSERESRLKK